MLVQEVSNVSVPWTPVAFCEAYGPFAEECSDIHKVGYVRRIPKKPIIVNKIFLNVCFRNICVWGVLLYLTP